VASIRKEISLHADPETAWTAIADVGGINKIITFLGEVRFDGEQRVCALGDATLEELIVSIDDDSRRVAYAITRSPFEFTHHHASMQVLPDEAGSTLVWITDFKPDEAAGPLGEALEASAASIAEALAQ
jgi:hypothetical protein